jgi:hypothetical protein
VRKDCKDWGHPLEGRSRGNDIPQEINFFISPLSTHLVVIFRLRAPVFNHSVSELVRTSHPSGSRR